VMTWVVRSYTLAFTWYVPLGVIVTLVVGGVMSLSRDAARAGAPSSVGS
jgi:hypothetical protein